MKTLFIRLSVIAASVLAVLLFFVNVTLVFHICPIPRHLCDAYLNKFNNLSVLAIIALLYVFVLLENFSSADAPLKNKKRNFILYYIGIAGIFAAGIFVRFVMVQLPSEFKDGNFITALYYLSHHLLVYPESRALGYPLYLTAILTLFKDFSAVCIAAHIIGILSGAVLVYIWHTMAKNSIFKQELKPFYYLSGLLLFALALLNSRRIYHENMMRVESVSPFLFLLAECLIVMIIVNDDRRCIPVLVFLNLYIISFQVKWMLAGVCIMAGAIIYVAINPGLKKIFWLKRNLVLIVLPILLYWAVCVVPVSLSFTNKSSVTTFASSHLFFTHLKIITKTMERDIADPYFHTYDKKLLEHICAAYETAHQEYLDSVGNPGLIGYTDKSKNMGFKFNALVWQTPIIQEIMDLLGNDPGKYNQFCKYYFFKAIITHPVEYGIKVFTELSPVYIPYRSYVFKENARNAYIPSYKNTLRDQPASIDPNYRSLPLDNFLERVQNILKNPKQINEKPVTSINIFYFLLEKMYGAAVVVSLVLAIALIIGYHRGKTTLSLCKHAWVTLIFHLIPFLMCLLTSSVYVLNNARYIDELFFSLLLSEFTAFTLIVAYIYDRVKPKFLRRR